MVKSILIFASILLVVLLFMFRDVIFIPDNVLFSNDSPLGRKIWDYNNLLNSGQVTWVDKIAMANVYVFFIMMVFALNSGKQPKRMGEDDDKNDSDNNNK